MSRKPIICSDVGIAGKFTKRQAPAAIKLLAERCPEFGTWQYNEETKLIFVDYINAAGNLTTAYLNEIERRKNTEHIKAKGAIQ